MYKTVLAVLLSACGSIHAAPLQFQPDRVPAGQVLHYLKSNIDGSNPDRICVYIAGPDRIESLKWHEGSTGATLVTAQMDWSRFSVRQFDAWQLDTDKDPRHRASLKASPDARELEVSFGATRRVRIHHWPWHSYDFDFASLGLVLPHWTDPRGQLSFWRTDTVFAGDEPGFEEIGEVKLSFQGVELRSGRETRRYVIAGKGLADTSGLLWTDAASGLIVEYRIPIPDEPGYTDGKLELLGMEPMTAQLWEQYKKRKAAGVE